MPPSAPIATLCAIAKACLGLVQELVEVFHVVESGGRPGARGEWTIGGPVFQYWEMLDVR
jgi:hypothetical protein